MNYFDNEIKRILSIVEFESIKETIYDWFFNIHTECFEHNGKGMWYLVYDLFNYDYICILEDGTIDTENSNEPEIAEIIKGYVSKETCADIRSRF